MLRSSYSYPNKKSKMIFIRYNKVINSLTLAFYCLDLLIFLIVASSTGKDRIVFLTKEEAVPPSSKAKASQFGELSWTSS